MDAADIFYKLSAGTKYKREKPKAKKEEVFVNKEKIIDNGPEIRGKKRDGIPKLTEKKKSKFLIDEDSEESKPSFIELFRNKRVKDINENVSSAKKKNQKQKSNLSKKSKKEQIELEKLAEFRNKLRISVSGGKVPKPFQAFEDLIDKYGVSGNFIKNLFKAGFSSPTPIQMQAIPPMLEGKQIMACAPTGSGKTIAFLLPVLHQLKKPMKKGFRAVIVSPTRELARQTYREALRLSEGTGLKINIISKINQRSDTVNVKSFQKFDLLIATPNRLVYLLNHEPPRVELKNVEWLIIDESDKLFETGLRGFRDQLAVIYNACDSANVKRAMFSATQTPLLTKWCKKNLKNLVVVNVGIRNSAVSCIQQELLFVGNEQGKLLAMRDLIRKGITPPVLVFVQTKERARELFNELVYDGINVDVIHSDRSQKQRDNVIQCFREGKVWVLICTELMGRGIDFKGVSLVVNYDFPPTTVSYIHRIGRTGRAGRPGRAITFFTHDDEVNLRNIAHVLKESGCYVPEFILKLKKSNKRYLKKLATRAPWRESISTTPLYEKIYERKRRKMEIEGQSEPSKEEEKEEEDEEEEEEE